MNNERNTLKKALIDLANRHGGVATIASSDTDLVRVAATAFGVPAPAFKEPRLPFEKHPALLAAVTGILRSAGVSGIQNATVDAIAAMLDQKGPGLRQK